MFQSLVIIQGARIIERSNINIFKYWAITEFNTFYLLNLFTPQKAFVNGPVFLSKIEEDL